MATEISRRQFVQSSALAAIGAILHSDNAHGETDMRRLKEIGLIGNVISSQLKQDWKGTLKQVSDIGYRYLEFGSYFGASREECKQYLREIRLTPLCGGSSMGQMKKEDVLAKMIDEAHFFEKKYITCYWPWMDSGNNKKLDDFKKAAEDINELGLRCSKGGIRLAFHNHDKEFVAVDGYRYGYEVLLKDTDPANVAMHLDLYWITKGGADPVDFLQQYPDRFELFHVKDMDKTSNRSFTCPGYGNIDFKKIFRAAKNTSVKYYIVEIDEAPDPMQCIKDSYQYLRKLKF